MQMMLALLEHADAGNAQPTSPWDQIDPLAQTAALEILARLIAQQLATQPIRETVGE